MSAPLGVALIGAGTVGREVARAFLERPDALLTADGSRLELVGVAVRDVAKAAAGGIPSALLTDAPAHLIASPGTDVVVEVMGGEEPARTLITAALNGGRSVVTANKHLLAHHGPELEAAARRGGTALRFEASVGGGIPVLTPLAADLASNDVRRVRGIVNGTTNYILTEMAGEQGGSYADVLAAAQVAGYAEADPTADVEGLDAVNKLVVLARLAFGAWLDPSKVPNRAGDGAPGITGVTKEDLDAANEAGLAIKLLASAARTSSPDTIEASVSCVAVSQWSELAWIDGVTNHVEIEAEPLGRVSFMGPGAGGSATASAILGDLLAIARSGGSTWAGLPEAGRGRVEMPASSDWFESPSGAKYPRVDA